VKNFELISFANADDLLAQSGHEWHGPQVIK
jgi:hypothetical protein